METHCTVQYIITPGQMSSKKLLFLNTEHNPPLLVKLGVCTTDVGTGAGTPMIQEIILHSSTQRNAAVRINS